MADFDPSAFEQWDPKTREEVAARLQKELEGDIRYFYCKRGRECDGMPHEGYEYNHARSDQWPPPGQDWFLWLIISGRGAGKTRTGAEWLRKISRVVPRMAMIGRRGPDVRDTMVEGESGLIRVCEQAGMAYTWEPSKRLFTFGNGAKVHGYSGEEPDTLRGPQHGAAWIDEPAHIALIEDVWSNLLMGLRIPGLPGGAKVLCTSTPLPIKWLKERMKEEDTRIVRVSTYANLANLDPRFKKAVIERYEGTRLGRQELHGEIIEEVEGALWNGQMLDDLRTPEFDRSITPLERIVVGVDPAGTAVRRSDETGIVVVGKIGEHWYVLEDASGKYTPAAWANRVVAMYEKWSADKVVVEKNYGGDMVESNMRSVSASLPIQTVNSRRGKFTRAEPIAALYEQGKVHHVGTFNTLEEQMTEWVPGTGDSPDRVDALVHAITALRDKGGPAEIAVARGPRPVTAGGLLAARRTTIGFVA